MTLWLWLSISTVLTTPPTTSEADLEARFEKKCSKNDPQSCRQTVVAGEAVPFSGQLMTPRRAAKLAVMAGQCKERVKLAVEEATTPLKMDLALERNLREDDKATSKLQSDLWERNYTKVEEAAKRQPYEHPLLWVVIGGLIVGGAVGIATGIISETRPTVVTVP